MVQKIKLMNQKEKDIFFMNKAIAEAIFAFEKDQYQIICKKNPKALVIVDAALLIESGNYKNMDKVVVVNTDEKNQMERILARGGLRKDEIVSRINNQMPNKEKNVMPTLY